ncbi:MAG: sensor histidine kinase, partial [Salinigranum sp.]
VGRFHAQSRRRAAALAAERERLADQREKLEILNRIVRHDVRNDLSVALGMADLIEEVLEPENRERCDTLQRALTDAVYLTETTREFVEALADDSELPRKPVDVGAVLRQQADAVGRSYSQATLSVGDLPDVEVLADDMLASVFRNVLANAVQHNRTSEPTVEVTVEANAEAATVRIADDGPGIPDDRKEAVFGRSERGLESDGTGIGLYLVDTLVTRYGGEVWVTDNEPSGACFHVRLPRASAPEDGHDGDGRHGGDGDRGNDGRGGDSGRGNDDRRGDDAVLGPRRRSAGTPADERPSGRR